MQQRVEKEELSQTFGLELSLVTEMSEFILRVLCVCDYN